MQQLNIDDLPPNEAMRILKDAVRISKHLKKVTDDPTTYLRLTAKARRVPNHEYSYDRPGVDAAKLLDWRALFRRFTKLDTERKGWSSSFWDTLKEIHTKHCIDDIKHVWVIDPKNPEYVLVYDGRSLFHESARNLIKKGESTHERNALIVTGVEGRELARRYERIHTCHRRANIYARAFMTAVELRLQPFINETLRYKDVDYRLYQETIFLLQIDGIQRSVTVSPTGDIVWGSSQVFDCR